MKWTVHLWNEARIHATTGVCLENPIGVLSKHIGLPTQYIQPWQFGHWETKKTGLWLYKLQPLVPTNIVEGREERILELGPSVIRKRLRSETYEGIANAMAAQWGNINQVYE